MREELEDVSASELTVPPQSLHPKVRIVWVVQSLLSAALFGAIVGAIDIGVTGIGLWVGPAVFGVFALIGVLHAVLRYRVWEYEVREDALYLERGVVTRVRTVVPYVRIQHVDASRGPVERAIGLASAVVYTAGSRGADVTIPGLTADGADDLQNRLKRMAILAEGDDAV
ncbi:PH domain-containing protein [Natronoarchaeum sp. GCM10025703]|uniref:PH domain-containing protein n=1 Tax=unclassified Natronoarchaeum TaxID=2620183 RepID=UPI003620FEED